MTCGICGASAAALHTHHLDWDHDNNRPGNLIRVCVSCHVNLHRIGFMTAAELVEVRAEVRRRDPDRFQPELFD